MSKRAILRALFIGIAVGLRSQIPLAVLAFRRNDAPRSARWRNWVPYRSKAGRVATIVGAAGEVVLDKLPVLPSRLTAAPLGGRLVFGAFAGAAIGSEYRGKGPVIGGAIVGSIGAAAGAYGGYHARQAASKATGLPDPAVAVGEDALSYVIAYKTVTAGR